MEDDLSCCAALTLSLSRCSISAIKKQMQCTFNGIQGLIVKAKWTKQYTQVIYFYFIKVLVCCVRVINDGLETANMTMKEVSHLAKVTTCHYGIL